MWHMSPCTQMDDITKQLKTNNMKIHGLVTSVRAAPPNKAALCTNISSKPFCCHNLDFCLPADSFDQALLRGRHPCGCATVANRRHSTDNCQKVICMTGQNTVMRRKRVLQLHAAVDQVCAIRLPPLLAAEALPWLP